MSAAVDFQRRRERVAALRTRLLCGFLNQHRQKTRVLRRESESVLQAAIAPHTGQMSAGTQRSTPSSVEWLVVRVSFYGIIFFSAVLIIGAVRFVVSWRNQRRVLPRPAAVMPVEALYPDAWSVD